jgi:hypothetical protein
VLDLPIALPDHASNRVLDAVHVVPDDRDDAHDEVLLRCHDAA